MGRRRWQPTGYLEQRVAALYVLYAGSSCRAQKIRIIICEQFQVELTLAEVKSLIRSLGLNRGALVEQSRENLLAYIGSEFRAGKDATGIASVLGITRQALQPYLNELDLVTSLKDRMEKRTQRVDRVHILLSVGFTMHETADILEEPWHNINNDRSMLLRKGSGPYPDSVDPSDQYAEMVFAFPYWRFALPADSPEAWIKAAWKGYYDRLHHFCRIAVDTVGRPLIAEVCQHGHVQFCIRLLEMTPGRGEALRENVSNRLWQRCVQENFGGLLSYNDLRVAAGEAIIRHIAEQKVLLSEIVMLITRRIMKNMDSSPRLTLRRLYLEYADSPALNFSELGRELGITRQAVNFNQKKGLEAMRRRLREEEARRLTELIQCMLG